jgi:Kef-type K+ transport system membrane component KefB/Trk K+ transport system NAD-binding subunit
MEEHLNFSPLLLVTLMAFIVPLILARVKWLPIVVGEILAGVIIGNSGFNLIAENATLDIFSNIGLAFLMFLAGLEIDFNKIFPSAKNSRASMLSGANTLGLPLIAYLLTFGLAIPAGFALNRLGLEANPWLLAFILTATSLGVLLPMLKERGMIASRTGQLIFFTAMLADFLTVILLTVFIILLNQGLDLEIFSVVLLLFAFLLVYRLATSFFRLDWVRKLVERLSTVTVQIKVRGAIAILISFVVLAGALGLELILGAFLAGMIISLLKTPDDTDLVNKLEAFGFGFFIPVFFIQVGIGLDLKSLADAPESLLLLPALLGLSLLVKGLPTLLFLRQISWRETLGSAMLLNTHLSLEIAVTVIGLRLGLLSPAANVTIILFAVLTVFMMPALFNVILPPKKDEAPAVMVIFGANDLGLQVAKALQTYGERVKVIDPEPRLVDQAQRAGFEAYLADNIDECLEQTVYSGLHSLLVLSGEDTKNLLVSHSAARHGVTHIVALVNEPSRLNEFRALGATTFTPSLYQPTLLALLARSPDLLRLLTSTTDDQDVREITLHNPLAEGQRLSTLGLPGSLLVLSVGRAGEILVPHGNTRLETNDRLTILGSIDELNKVEQWLTTV